MGGSKTIIGDVAAPLLSCNLHSGTPQTPMALPEGIESDRQGFNPANPNVDLHTDIRRIVQKVVSGRYIKV